MKKYSEIAELVKEFFNPSKKLIEKASERFDQYGKSEAYKEKFYDVVRAYQEKEGLSVKEGIKRAEKVFRLKDKAEREAEKQGIDMDYYDVLQDLYDDDLITEFDMDVVSGVSP